jgi:Tfp pilus assembly protein PilN
MSHNLTNLLPPERARELNREYLLRLVTVGALIVAMLVVVSGLLLVPSYRSLQDIAAEKQATLTALGGPAKVQTQNQAETTQFMSTVSYLGGLGQSATASEAVRAVLLIPRTGVILSSITFSAPTASGAVKTPAKMTLSGTATTREALRAYDLALSEAAFVSNVDLPISAYAKESNIVFTMTLTGSLKP